MAISEKSHYPIYPLDTRQPAAQEEKTSVALTTKQDSPLASLSSIFFKEMLTPPPPAEQKSPKNQADEKGADSAFDGALPSDTDSEVSEEKGPDKRQKPTSLNLRGYLLEPMQEVIALIKSHPDVESLILPEYRTTDDLLEAIAFGCKSLKSLTITECNAVTDHGLISIIVNCGHALNTLNLYGCSKLTDRTLAAIHSHCPLLTALDLAFCDKTTIQGILPIVQRCQGLTHLKLTDCCHLKNQHIIDIARNCPNLTHLCLAHCNQLNDQTLIAIAASCPKLIDLNIRNCDQITTHSIGVVFNNCRALMSIGSCLNGEFSLTRPSSNENSASLHAFMDKHKPVVAAVSMVAIAVIAGLASKWWHAGR